MIINLMIDSRYLLRNIFVGILTVCSILMYTPTYAYSVVQKDIVINGNVKNNKGEALSGVSVKLKGGSVASVTNLQGNFSIKVPNEQAVLIFSLLGFETTEIKASGKEINIILQEKETNLDQVIVVGYGTQKKRDVTGAIGSISEEQMDKFPTGAINSSLQGKIAGLNITTNSGEPGAGATVTLRGVTSVNGASQPLYIIDGVIMDANSFSSETDNATFSPLNDINPADIKSIEVLKDGASASIYGSRASNGVIIITTKSGENSIKPQINFSSNTSLTGLNRSLGVLNGPQWRSAYIDAIFNQSGILTTKKAVVDSLHPYYSASRDWQNIMYKDVIQAKLDLSLSGSTKDRSVNYYISAGFRDLPPIILNTTYKQLTATARINYKISNAIKGSTNFNISNYDYKRVRTGVGNYSVIYQGVATLPVYSPIDPITGQIVPLFEGSQRNPYAIAMYAKNDIERFRLLAKQDLNLTITRGLSFNTSLALDYGNNTTSAYNPPIIIAANSRDLVTAFLNKQNNRSFITENTLTYKYNYKKSHNLTALLGQSYQLFKTDAVNLRGIGGIDSEISTINGASSINVYQQNLSDNALLSYFGRINYDFKSRYLFSAVLRRDGSSRFGANNRYGSFPSVSAGWRFTDEPWFKKPNSKSILHDGKLRASYGVTGNQQIGDYVFQGLISRLGTYLGEVAVGSNALPNNDLKWETTKQTNIGIDLSFLGGRINFNADAYLKRTDDLLFNVQVPVESGYTSTARNNGSLENKGLEFLIDAKVIDKTVKWNAIVTYGLNRNKMVALPGDLDYRPNAWNLARVGEPVGVFYGLRSLGVYSKDTDNIYKTDPTTGAVTPYRRGSVNGVVYKGGDVIWEDVNKDGIINDDDLQIIGNPTPKWTGGLSNTVTYKQFSISAFIYVSYGNHVFNQLKRSLDASATDANFSTDQLRRWKKQGDVTDVPKLTKADPMLNYAVSSRFVEDASFIRLQNVSFNYNIPKTFVKKIGMESASIGVSGANLLTFSKYKGYDPEVSASNNALELGVDNGAFPKSRLYNFSLNVRF